MAIPLNVSDLRYVVLYNALKIEDKFSHFLTPRKIYGGGRYCLSQFYETSGLWSILLNTFDGAPLGRL